MFKRLMQLLNREQKSKDVAKSRLQLILVQDRTGIDEEIMESLQTELTEVLSKYFILEQEQVEMELEREQDSMALVANIPVLGTKVRHPIQAETRQLASDPS